MLYTYRLDVDRMNSEESASEKWFHVEVSRRHLSTRQHEEHADDRVQGNVDDVVSIRRQTTHQVVHSAAIHNLPVTCLI